MRRQPGWRARSISETMETEGGNCSLDLIGVHAGQGGIVRLCVRSVLDKDLRI